MWPVRCLGELSGLDGIREEGSGIMLCLGLRNVKAAGCVWSLPACLPDAAGVKVWRQVLHVRLPEPERTAFQFSRPWRKQITSDRKQLLLTWRAETLPHGATWSPHECRWKVRSDETFGGRGM